VKRRIELKTIYAVGRMKKKDESISIRKHGGRFRQTISVKHFSDLGIKEINSTLKSFKKKFN